MFRLASVEYHRADLRGFGDFITVCAHLSKWKFCYHSSSGSVNLLHACPCLLMQISPLYSCFKAVCEYLCVRVCVCVVFECVVCACLCVYWVHGVFLSVPDYIAGPLLFTSPLTKLKHSTPPVIIFLLPPPRGHSPPLERGSTRRRGYACPLQRECSQSSLE